MRQLNEMTLAELWELFPIELTPHNPLWSEWARDEIRSLAVLLVDYRPVINHIGSTAISAIQAKPILDILVEISPDADWTEVKNIMENHGYICMSESDSRMSFNRGYTPYGYAEQVYHIHFHCRGDNDEVYFRDYLNAHPDEACEYERLKLGLLPRYRNDRDGYTAAKTDFIKHILSQKPQKNELIS